MKAIIIAVTAIALDLGVFTQPALAQADDYGQDDYMQNEPSRFAPAGLASGKKVASGVRDTSGDQGRLNGRIDSYHLAY